MTVICNFIVGFSIDFIDSAYQKPVQNRTLLLSKMSASCEVPESQSHDHKVAATVIDARTDCKVIFSAYI